MIFFFGTFGGSSINARFSHLLRTNLSMALIIWKNLEINTRKDSYRKSRKIKAYRSPSSSASGNGCLSGCGLIFLFTLSLPPAFLIICYFCVPAHSRSLKKCFSNLFIVFSYNNSSSYPYRITRFPVFLPFSLSPFLYFNLFLPGLYILEKQI